MTCAGFLQRAIAYFAAHGIARIDRLITDNAWASRFSLREVCADHGIRHEFHQAALPLAESGRSNASTAPWQPNGPPGSRSPPTSNAETPVHPGSSITTVDDTTQPSEATHPSADCTNVLTGYN